MADAGPGRYAALRIFNASPRKTVYFAQVMSHGEPSRESAAGWRMPTIGLSRRDVRMNMTSFAHHHAIEIGTLVVGLALFWLMSV